ncbi:MAG: demethoxyubiquinone hydroxylase family protein [Gammaproteobacteria bacterium]
MPFAELGLPENLARDLQSDHAGETGAVYIYHGVLAVSRDPIVRAFAHEHLATEQAHLAFFEQWLPRRYHSRLIPVWRLAGFLLGALPALFGARAVWVTIEAVETFVETHYGDQIELLEKERRWASLRTVLMAFCADEVAHRNDAGGRRAQRGGPLARLWAQQVDIGSRVGVWLARRY